MNILIRDVPTGETTETPGIDPGGKVTIWHRTPQFIVLKIDGGMYWSGIGHQSYAPARFEVYKINPELDRLPDREGFIKLESLVGFDIRKSS